MATSFTQALRKQFVRIGEDPANFAAEFDRWKVSFPSGEFSHPLFGKDGAYTNRLGAEVDMLRHVHLIPLQDPAALAKWEVNHLRRSRKTSDRVLVYASDERHGHLLIYILEEPTAHAVAQMKTPQHRELMLKLAKIASRFVEDGVVIG